MSADTVMPLKVGVRLTHAAVQAIADSAGIDVLHIKGPAVDPGLLAMVERVDSDGRTVLEPVDRSSIDVDVLVRPSQVQDLIGAMRRHEWTLKVDFPDGSSFEHAATMAHPRLVHVDVHRSFPGFGHDAAAVFDRLWHDRRLSEIAGIPCAVPDETAQRLVLILNAVRGGPSRRSEIDRLWDRASDEDRAAVQRLADETGAQVALAAATGRLAEYRTSREHDLWELLASGQSAPVAMWKARVRAQPTVRAAVREGVKRVVPNAGRLALRLGHAPSRRELAAAWVDQARTGARAVRDVVRQKARRA